MKKHNLFTCSILILFFFLLNIPISKAQKIRLNKFISNDEVSYVKLMFVGDIPINKKVVEAAYRNSTHSYDFQPVFHYIRPYLNLGDIVVGSLETTIGTPPFGKFPQYRSPKDVATSLKYTGFNLLMTANGKSLYQDNETWNTQNDLFKKVKIEAIGSYENEQDKLAKNPMIIEKKGIKIAFLNYMDGIENNTSSSPIVNFADTALIKKDIQLAKEKGAEFIVAYMNWGVEFDTHSNARQQVLSKKITSMGVNLIIGTHPHTVQDMEVYKYNENGKTREAISIYSLGDFLSTANSTKVNSSCIFEIIVSKRKSTNNIEIEDYGYIPTYCYSYNYKGKLTWSIVPVHQIELDNIEIQFMSLDEKKNMIASANNIRRKFSPYMQEVEYKLTNEIINDVAESLTVTKRPMNENRNVELEKINLLHQSYGFGRVLDTDKKADPNAPVYKVQFMSAKREVKVDTRFYRHLKGYEVVREDGHYNYTIGSNSDLAYIQNLCTEVKRLGHKKAFIVVYAKGRKMRVD